MTFRAIAFDLDGTLLDSNKEISPSSLEAVRRAQDKGIKVIIATGRHPQATHLVHHRLGLTDQAICCNGACIYDFEAGKPVYSNPLQQNQIEGLYHLCRHYDLPIKLYTDSAITYEKVDPYVVHFQQWRKTVPERFQPNLQLIDDYEALIAAHPVVWKYTLWGDQTSVMQALANEATEAFNLSCEWWSPHGIDITRADNTKGSCLIHWAEERGIALEEIIAFGDNQNDISMLNAVGLSVAMGQADAYVQAEADLIAPGTNDSDAIAEVLERYVWG